jgi:hypothetical protein
MTDYQRRTLDEDWLKTRYWDVRNPDGTQVTTLDQLCHGRVTPESVQEWVALPAWRAAPKELKAESAAYLKAHPPTPAMREMDEESIPVPPEDAPLLTPGDEEGNMTRRDSREELQKWFSQVDELLAAEREHAISPSTVPPPSTEPAVWKMRLSTLRRDLAGLIDLLVSNPGRWIFILDVGPHGVGRYVQLLVHEDSSILAEACSNNYLEGSYRLNPEEEAALVAIGWKKPRLPDKPNWWAVRATTRPDTSEVARLVLGTFEGVYGLCDTEMITGRVISSPLRGNTPAMKAARSPAKFVTPFEGTERAGRYRWSDAFHRSQLSPIVFVVAADFVKPVRDVLEANHAALVTQGEMFDNYYGSTGLLDGLVIFVRTYGFPAGQLSSGWRVLGYRPMRLLCLLMGLEAPRRRLRGEHVVATPEDLLEAWQYDERAQVQANRGLGIAHRVQLLVLVRELFGEEYLPTPMGDDLKAALPAVSSRWALSGFNRLAEDKFSAAGIGVGEAIAWTEHGLKFPWEVLAVHPYGLSTIETWIEAGYYPTVAARYLAKGRTLDQLAPYVTAGCPHNVVDRYLDAGLEPEVVTEYQDAGIEGFDAANFAGGGLLPDAAKRWHDLGFNAYAAQRILAAGGTLDEALRLSEQGLSRAEIEKRVAGK